MRYFITAPVLIASALAQSTADYLNCASAAIGTISKSTFTSCTGKTSQECFCANKSAIKSLTTTSIPACVGLDISTVASVLCPSSREAKPAFRHAGKPMQPVKRDPKYTIYVTETRTDCGCKSTGVAGMRVSQVPVSVPTSSVRASSTSVARHGAASSIRRAGVAPSAGVMPSAGAGVDATRFSPFQGAAVGVSVHGGVVVLGVAAVMAVMVGL
ncbi:hypothetical protein N7491_011024 [Penicillium cf. griseofulvum]|uniref:Extracellular membrane protein CFEM domain-containing protein n=1 Tax=Penicillium cf. griseofulvum TaxID=2972120 RepID=A0A9W9T6E1_9EURO|nr:hypothetical protein N7472_001343 [Penicillium cf. griseofulvum]KAJ5422579.1 hypothetical protein N7491_011024 [Penicillium cf. griseofulvum]